MFEKKAFINVFLNDHILKQLFMRKNLGWKNTILYVKMFLRTIVIKNKLYYEKHTKKHYKNSLLTSVKKAKMKCYYDKSKV